MEDEEDEDDSDSDFWSISIHSLFNHSLFYISNDIYMINKNIKYYLFIEHKDRKEQLIKQSIKSINKKFIIFVP